MAENHSPTQNSPTQTATFTVVFSGKLNGLHPLDVVQRQFAQLFKTNADQTAQLFSGKRVVLKTGISKEQAEKYQKAIHQAGGECTLEEIQPAKTQSPPSQIPSQPAPSPAPVLKPAPEPITNFSLAPVGAQLSARKKEIPITAPKIDHLSVAPAGVVLGEPKKEVIRTFKSIDSITLAKAGEYIPSIPKPPAPPAPDTDHLSLKK
jgi:hypothetical protein